MARKVFILFSLVLLIYMIAPGPSSINSFADLPNSVKSNLPGDTVQVPNVAGYFSNNYRDFTTSFYRDNYQSLTVFPFPPIRLNYPPEFSYTAIKDQTQTTYLEEYVYPLRDSLYVNGFEPFYEDGTPKYDGAIKFDIGPIFYDNKATIRFYHSNILIRFIVWLGIVSSIYILWKISKKIIFNV